MRLLPKDTYLNGEHIAHEPSIFQVAARKGHYLPQILIGGILFYIIAFTFLITFISK